MTWQTQAKPATAAWERVQSDYSAFNPQPIPIPAFENETVRRRLWPVISAQGQRTYWDTDLIVSDRIITIWDLATDPAARPDRTTWDTIPAKNDKWKNA